MSDNAMCSQCGEPAVGAILQLVILNKAEKDSIPPGIKDKLTPDGYLVGSRLCQDHLDYFAGESKQKDETIRIVDLAEWGRELAKTEFGRRTKEQE